MTKKAESIKHKGNTSPHIPSKGFEKHANIPQAMMNNPTTPYKETAI